MSGLHLDPGCLWLIGGVILMWAFLRTRSSVPLTVGSAAAVAAAVVVIAYASI